MDITNFKANGQKYDDLIITDNRLIFYKRAGLVFKKDIVETIGLKTLQGIKFKETGLIKKQGVIEILGNIKWTITGKREELKTLYQALSDKLKV